MVLKYCILKYCIACDGNVRYNHLIKLGCSKKQARTIKEILSHSEMIELYRGDSEICRYIANIGRR